VKERHYTREHHYKGPVEAWVDDDRRFEGEIHLTRRESVEETETLRGIESVVVPATWDGRFRGVAQEDLRRLQVDREFELRLPDGSVGQAVLPNGRDLAYLQGLGDPPF
jgi:hypothetical protein